MWKRVIVSRHGEPSWARRGEEGARGSGRKVGWWNKIVKLVEGSDGRWFWKNVRRRVGDGRKTEFWECDWTGQATLKVLFPQLYNVCTQKEVLINEMGRWSEGAWVWDVEWRRELREWEAAGANEFNGVAAERSYHGGTV